MNLKFKKTKSAAKLPEPPKFGDAGLDLIATDCLISDTVNGYLEYGTGLSVEIPEGYVGLLFSRSSVSNTALILANCVGVIDSSYRGEIKFRFKAPRASLKSVRMQQPWLEAEGLIYKKGDKVGQLVVVPYLVASPILVDELAESDRGENGFGSTGK